MIYCFLPKNNRRRQQNLIQLELFQWKKEKKILVELNQKAFRMKIQKINISMVVYNSRDFKSRNSF